MTNGTGKHVRGMVFMVCVLAVFACESWQQVKEKAGKTPVASQRSAPTVIMDTVVGTCRGAFEAVQTPLVDLNIQRDEIPAKLAQLQPRPYSLRNDLCCEVIIDEIAQLDALLGPDVDALPWRTASSDSYVDKGAVLAQQQAIGLVAGQVDILPYRGMVRKLSGAERHARAVAAAYHAGQVRRAFYKGLGVAYGCFLPQIATEAKTKPK